jgi:hypothetical protein
MIQPRIALAEECCLDPVIMRLQRFMGFPDTVDAEVILKVRPDTGEVPPRYSVSSIRAPGRNMLPFTPDKWPRDSTGRDHRPGGGAAGAGATAMLCLEKAAALIGRRC